MRHCCYSHSTKVNLLSKCNMFLIDSELMYWLKWNQSLKFLCSCVLQEITGTVAAYKYAPKHSVAEVTEQTGLWECSKCVLLNQLKCTENSEEGCGGLTVSCSVPGTGRSTERESWVRWCSVSYLPLACVSLLQQGGRREAELRLEAGTQLDQQRTLALQKRLGQVHLAKLWLAS